MIRTFSLCWLLLGWLLGITPAWSAPGRILILNSDTAVAKYSMVEKEFQANLTVAFISLDLGGETSTLTPVQIQRAIDDYDPMVIYCIGTKALALAKELASKRKRVFSSLVNWHRLQMDEYTFGIANDLHVGMQVTLVRYLFPDLKRIGIPYSKQFNQEWVAIATREAAQVGIQVRGYPVEDSGKLQKIMGESLPDLDAVWLIADPVALAKKEDVKMLFQTAEAHKKPVFAYSDVFSKIGAALVLSVDLPTIARQAAMLAEQLAKGVPVSGENVIDPAGSHIALDKRKIVRYGISLNKNALGAVNTFIE